MEATLYIDPASIANILGTVGSPLIVISELIKNSIDASADNVTISYNKDANSITVQDDGLGFTLSDIQQLSKPGFSRKKTNGNVTNSKGSVYTGSKGLGLLSVFSLCNHLTIHTKSENDGEFYIDWSKEQGRYTYEKIAESQMDRGTIIVLNNIAPQVMALLTSESEVKKLRHVSTYLYKHDRLALPEINLSIDGAPSNSLLFNMEFSDMLFDVTFDYNNQDKTLSFKCESSNPEINGSKIIINSFETAKIESILDQYFNIRETIKTRTNDNISFRVLEDIEGLPTFEGRILVYEKKTAGGMLKDYGAGVNFYANDFALYNYLSEEFDWLGLADFSQRKKATRLKPHNVFGFVNLPYFNETAEQLKISNERADFIQDAVFVKLMYLIKGVIMFMILNIDVAEKNPKYKRLIYRPIEGGTSKPATSTGNTKIAGPETNEQSKTVGQTNNKANDKNKDSLDNDDNEANNTVTNDTVKEQNQNFFVSESENIADEQEENYEPESTFKPQHRKRNHLSFTKSEGQLFEILKNSDDLGNKIYQAVSELSRLNVLFYPYSAVCLYRTLIEAATRYYANKNSIEYKEAFLPNSINNVLNKWSNNTNASKEFRANVNLWRDLVNKRHLTEKLNLYIHNSTPVDVDLVLDTWQSMKSYIRECIKS